MNVFKLFMGLKNSLALLILFHPNVLFIGSNIVIYSLSDVLFHITHIMSCHSRDVLPLDEISFIWSYCIKHLFIPISSVSNNLSVLNVSIFHLLKSFRGTYCLFGTLSSFVLNDCSSEVSRRRRALMKLFLIHYYRLLILYFSLIRRSACILGRRLSVFLSLVLRNINISWDRPYNGVLAFIWNRWNHVYINANFSCLLWRRSKMLKRSISRKRWSVSFLSSKGDSSLSMFLSG